MDCVTPSHASPIPPGESLDIAALLAKGDAARLDPAVVPRDPPDPARFAYTPRVPVMQAMGGGGDARALPYLRAQMAADRAEFDGIVKALKQPVGIKPGSSTPPPLSSLNDKPERAKRGPRKKQQQQQQQEKGVQQQKKGVQQQRKGVQQKEKGVQQQQQQHQSEKAQRYDARPAPMPVDWEEENKFIRLYEDKESRGGNTAVDVGLMRRMGTRQAYARH